MADPGPKDPQAGRFDDPTRDIRLPPAPGSPPLVVRPEWSSYPARHQPESDAPAAPPTAVAETAVSRRPMDLLADEPTDQLVAPGGRPRERTLEFTQSEGRPVRSAAAPVAPAVPDRSRRWPWVLMALLPIVVIVGSGIWLFVLLSHA